MILAGIQTSRSELPNQRIEHYGAFCAEARRTMSTVILHFFLGTIGSLGIFLHFAYLASVDAVRALRWAPR